MNEKIIQLDIHLFDKPALTKLRSVLLKELKRNEKDLKKVNTPDTRFELRREQWDLVGSISKLNVAIVS